VLLREMQIQNPTAVMIARTAVAQDDISGWGHAAMQSQPGGSCSCARRAVPLPAHARVLWIPLLRSALPVILCQMQQGAMRMVAFAVPVVIRTLCSRISGETCVWRAGTAPRRRCS